MLYLDLHLWEEVKIDKWVFFERKIVVFWEIFACDWKRMLVWYVQLSSNIGLFWICVELLIILYGSILWPGGTEAIAEFSNNTVSNICFRTLQSFWLSRLLQYSINSSSSWWRNMCHKPLFPAWIKDLILCFVNLVVWEWAWNKYFNDDEKNVLSEDAFVWYTWIVRW